MVDVPRPLALGSIALNRSSARWGAKQRNLEYLQNAPMEFIDVKKHVLLRSFAGDVVWPLATGDAAAKWSKSLMSGHQH